MDFIGINCQTTKSGVDRVGELARLVLLLWLGDPEVRKGRRAPVIKQDTMHWDPTIDDCSTNNQTISKAKKDRLDLEVRNQEL